MRASSKKTPAAVLRSIIGIKVPEMAELLQCSTATIQSIESGRLKVTDMMAFKMYDHTGVSIQWLKGKDAKRPITDEGKLAHAEQKGDVFIPVAKTGRFLTSLEKEHVKDYVPPTGPRGVAHAINRQLADLETIKQDIRDWSRSRKQMLAEVLSAAKRDSARQTKRD